MTKTLDELQAEVLLTVSEAASLLGLTTRALYAAIHRRQVPYIKLGKRVRFKLSVLMRFVEQGAVPVFQTSASPRSEKEP